MANEQEAPQPIARRKQNRDFIVSAERYSEESTKGKGLSQGPAGTILEPGTVVKTYLGILWVPLGAENPNITTIHPLGLVCVWDDTVGQAGGSLTNRILVKDAEINEELMVDIAGQNNAQYLAVMNILRRQGIITRMTRSTTKYAG